MPSKSDTKARDGDSKKRKRESDKDRQTKRPRPVEGNAANKKAAQDSSDANELRGNALKVLADLQTAGSQDASNGQVQKQDKALAKDTAGWKLSGGLGGRLANVDPVFSEDEQHIILASHTSLGVYTTSDSLLVRRIALPITTTSESGERKLSSSVVSMGLSGANGDFIWVGCSDGRIWRIDWRHGLKPQETVHTKSGTLLDLSISAIQPQKATIDVLYAAEQSKNESSITAYYRHSSSQLSSVLYTTQQTVSLVRSTSDGRAVVGATSDGLVVGTVQTKVTKNSLELEGDFYSFETPDIVCSLDVRFSTAKQSSNAATPKKQQPKKAAAADVLDVVAGFARGPMHVYNDIIQKLRNARSSKKKDEVQARKFHWHRRAVHALKCSLDGNYIVSGGSENTLVLWQNDTATRSYLPHLPGSIENIVVSPSGSSYAVHLDDNSAMIISTSEMKPTFYVSGLQTAARYLQPPKDSLVLRLSNPSKEVRNPIPAALNPSDPSKLHVCVGTGQQAVMTGTQQAAPILQSFDLETFRSNSRQTLARTQPTDVNITAQGHAISEPSVTSVAFSSDGNWLATVDDWEPPMRDVDGASGEARERFSQDRREVYLKFWAVSPEDQSLALISRINSPHSTSRPEPVLALAADPKSARFATLGDDGLVRIWTCKTRQKDGITSTDSSGQALQTWSCSLTVGMGSNVGADVLVTADGEPRTGSLSFSEDGSTLFVAFGSKYDGTVYVVDTSSGEIRMTLQNLWKGTIRHLEVLSPYIITLSDDLRVYDVVADELQYGVKLKSNSPAKFSHLAVDKKSRTFAVVVPNKESSELAVLKPEEPNPLCIQSIPHRVLSLVSSPASTGFVAVDDVAQLWTVSEVSDQSSISLSRPLEELNLDDVVVEEKDLEQDSKGMIFLNGNDEAQSDGEEEAGEGMDVDDDLDDTHPAVISRQKLSELFDAAPAFAMPSIEDMFYKVTDLVANKPLASSTA